MRVCGAVRYVGILLSFVQVPTGSCRNVVRLTLSNNSTVKPIRMDANIKAIMPNKYTRNRVLLGEVCFLPFVFWAIKNSNTPHANI